MLKRNTCLIPQEKVEETEPYKSTDKQEERTTKYTKASKHRLEGAQAGHGGAVKSTAF
jgi:hypothetical protein